MNKRRSRKPWNPDVPGWVKTVTYVIILASTARAGHVVVDGPAPQPTTACVQLQEALLASRA